MEETELEEGEAPSYHDEAEDFIIDPDIDLSYMEETLQNVLGHFQKDFEGGVSAENLGTKFGGYGSFLPTYQRSPSWSHTRSPAQVQNYDSPRSPKKLHLEDQRQNSFASTSASPSAAVPLNALEDAVKGEALSASMEKEHLDSESAQRTGRFEKLGGSLGSAGEDSRSKKANVVSNIAAAEKIHAVDCSESNVVKGRRDLTAAAPEGEKSGTLDHYESRASKEETLLLLLNPQNPRNSS